MLQYQIKYSRLSHRQLRLPILLPHNFAKWRSSHSGSSNQPHENPFPHFPNLESLSPITAISSHSRQLNLASPPQRTVSAFAHPGSAILKIREIPKQTKKNIQPIHQLTPQQQKSSTSPQKPYRKRDTAKGPTRFKLDIQFLKLRQIKRLRPQKLLPSLICSCNYCDAIWAIPTKQRINPDEYESKFVQKQQRGDGKSDCLSFGSGLEMRRRRSHKLYKNGILRPNKLLECFQFKIQSETIQMKTRKTRLNWSSQEDELIRSLHEGNKLNSWKKIARELKKRSPFWKRTAKQCRERYINCLRFGGEAVENSEWTRDEEAKLFQYVLALGPRWVKIAQMMPGKSENCLKNKFYGSLRKTIRKVNKVEKQYGLKSRKQIKYESLLKFLEISSVENEKEYHHKFGDKLPFFRSIKADLFQLTVSQQQNSPDRYLIISDKLHQFNSATRYTVCNRRRAKTSGKQSACSTGSEEDKSSTSLLKQGIGQESVEDEENGKQDKMEEGLRKAEKSVQDEDADIMSMFVFNDDLDNIVDCNFMRDQVDALQLLF